MGIVYKAYDTLIQRQVAVKTLHDIRDRAALDLFYKEWGVLASLVHPNIVQVYDVGEFNAGGEPVPFFVMPLLPGVTFSKLIYDDSRRLSVQRAVDIVCQACRGIQAAHDAKLVHRDIKPSNILVLDDDSVKIIDFGVAHLVGKEGTTGLKGTPYYMAPEQIRLQGPSALTDIYSLGVVAYEALTRRRPVQGSNDAEIADSILNDIAPAASDINPEVSDLLSRVLHKAMAKQPWHRFASAREFSETLQKVMRNEPVEFFDPARIQPRIERAQRAFDNGEFDFASEILAELEAEGCLEAQMTLLRRRLNEIQRRKRVQVLVEGAARCLEEHEYTLALRKVEEALQLDPEDGNVLSLKARIETARGSRKLEESLEAAERHLATGALARARKALENVLETQPDQPRAKKLLADLDVREGRDSKRDEAVAWCLAKARQLEAEGKADEALQLTERVLATYPGASQLERLRDTLRPLLEARPAETDSHQQTRDLEELRLIAHQAEQPVGEAVAQGLAGRAEQIARRWPDDATIRAAAADVLRKLRPPESPAVTPTPGQSPPGQSTPAQSPRSLTHRPAKPPGRALTASGAPPADIREAESLGAGSRAVSRSGRNLDEHPMPGDRHALRDAVGALPDRDSRALHDAAHAQKDLLTSDGLSARKSQKQPLLAWLGNLAAAGPEITRRAARNIYVWLVAAVALCALLIVGGVALLNRTTPEPPPAAPGVLQVTTQAGAKVVLAGSQERFECTAPDCRLSVPAGEYRVEASLAGFRPASGLVTIDSGAQLPLALDLEPLPVVLRLISDLQQATVHLDSEQQASVEEGFLDLTLPPGTYPIEVRSGSLTASMLVDIQPGRAPRLDGPVESRELQAYVIASFAGTAEVRSSEPGVAVQLDGEERGDASEEALQFAGFSPGFHELAFRSGGREIRRNVEIADGPTLTAILVTDRNLGGLVVDTGVNDAEVVIDDGRYRKRTGNGGRARFTLAPGDYRASVSRPGHQTPPPQAFTIRKGDETRLSFELPANPRMASLELAGAPPGAEVWLDNQRAGEVSRGGAYAASVPAGPHRIELRNLPEMYAPQPVEKQFAEGATVTLANGELPMRAVKGQLQIQVEPDGINATVTIRPAGTQAGTSQQTGTGQQAGAPEQAIRPGTHYREPGDYIVAATAPGYQKSEAGRRVTLGQTTVFRLTLTREAVQQERRRFGIEELAKMPGFEKAEGILVRRGGDFALLPLSPATGTYTFTVNARGGGLLRGVGIGRARIQWTAAYTDESNHVLFQLGEDALTRSVISKGQQTETQKIPHGCPRVPYYSVTVEITPAAITHKLLCKGQWTQLDQYTPTGASPADGKFGFFVPGNTTLAVSHFDAVGP